MIDRCRKRMPSGCPAEETENWTPLRPARSRPTQGPRNEITNGNKGVTEAQRLQKRREAPVTARIERQRQTR